MSESFDAARRARLAEINAAPQPREGLEAAYGRVWDAQELARDFEVIGYLAPFVVVRRRADGVLGSLEFQASPRFYFAFRADEPRSQSACPWCHAMTPTTDRFCKDCGHEAHVARTLCRCPRCTRGEPGPALAAEDVEAVLAWLRRRAGGGEQP
jgi:hypothetical protein